MLLLPCLLMLPTFQEPVVSQPEAAELARVLREAARPDGFHMFGSVSERKSEEGGGAMVMGVGGAGSKYSGDIDAWRTSKDELFVLTRKRLPELAIYDDGDQLIVRTTCGDDALDASQTSTDLAALLDLGALQKTVEGMATAEGKPKVVRSRVEGELERFECELPPRFIKSAGGMANMAMPKVMRIEARFMLDDKGRLAGMRFAVVRSDPFAQIRRNALDGAGSGPVVVNPTDLGEAEEGPSNVYELFIDGQAPHKRAQSVLDSLREAARSDDR
jgi:hypothetical protein